MVVDRLGSEGRNRRVTTVAIHSFSHAGKTKWWEHTWDTMEHIYPDKVSPGGLVLIRLRAASSSSSSFRFFFRE